MLFLGTEKYPDEEEYSRFLREHSGNYNAFTAVDQTVYLFEIGNEHFTGVLDMFAQFFIAPLFTEGSVTREVEAVESEHAKDIISNGWRSKRLNQIAFAPGHPNHKFDGGSAATLKVHADLRAQVMKFWEENYSANIMTLALLGSEDLDQLETLAREKFSAIKNKDLKEQTWTTPEQILKRSSVRASAAPVAESRKVVISWTHTPGWRSFANTKPDQYVAHILGHEAEGSLFSYLKGKGWAESLSAGSDNRVDYSQFSISIDLSTDGLAHLEDVVDAVFAYIALMKRTGPSEVLFNELKMLGELSFRFKDKQDPFRFFFSLALTSLLTYPLEEVFSGPHLVSDFLPDVITSIVDFFTPENAQILLYAKEVKDPKSAAHTLGDATPNLVEEHYGIEYRVDDLTDAQRQKWNGILSSSLSDVVSRWPGMAIPRPNPFLPEDLSIKPLPKDAPPADAPPAIIVDTPTLRFWHKQDQIFERPRATVGLSFACASSYNSPKTVAMTKILIEYISDSLNELSYDAEIAGLKYAVVSLLDGFEIRISGYNCKQKVLLREVLARFKDLKEIDHERFELLRNKTIKSYINSYFDQAYALSQYQLSLHRDEPRWNAKQYEQCVRKLTPAMVMDWMPQLLEHMYIEGLAMGNIDKEEALEIAKMVQETIKTEEMMPGQTRQLRTVQFDSKVQHWIQHISANPEETNSAVTNYYQIGVETVRGNALLQLLNQLVATDAFDALRTKEQLGYIVFTAPGATRNTMAWQILVQSAKQDPVYLDARIEAWLATVPTVLSSITEEVFKSNQRALAAEKRVKLTSLGKFFSRYWNHISTDRDYDFDLHEKMAKAIESLTLQEIVDFWNENLAAGAVKRSKMSIQVWPPSKIPHLPSDISPPIDLIDDAFDFKTTHPTYPSRVLPLPRKTEYKSTSSVHAPSAPLSPKVSPPQDH